MTASWASLYLPCADAAALVTALRTALVSQQYELYDPFGLLPGKAYAHTQRYFVSPAQAGWVRVLGLPELHICTALSHECLCLAVELDGAEATVDVFSDGQQVDPLAALAAHVRPGADLERAFSATFTGGSAPANPLLHHLPDDVQSMAAGVDSQQAQKLFERMSGGLIRKMGQRTGTDGDQMADAAQNLLGASAPDWNSSGGQRIRAVMAALTVPENWQTPDFTTLRDAYQLHRRRQRKPDARLYPGDAEALAQVPDALDYQPVYGGR